MYLYKHGLPLYLPVLTNIEEILISRLHILMKTFFLENHMVDSFKFQVANLKQIKNKFLTFLPIPHITHLWLLYLILTITVQMDSSNSVWNKSTSSNEFFSSVETILPTLKFRLTMKNEPPYRLRRWIWHLPISYNSCPDHGRWSDGIIRGKNIPNDEIYGSLNCGP